jgi:hypothetical protein
VSGTGTQQGPKGFLVTILDGIMNWLASLIKLTEEDQEDAGIYPGHLGRE